MGDVDPDQSGQIGVDPVPCRCSDPDWINWLLIGLVWIGVINDQLIPSDRIDRIGLIGSIGLRPRITQTQLDNELIG